MLWCQWQCCDIDDIMLSMFWCRWQSCDVCRLAIWGGLHETMPYVWLKCACNLILLLRAQIYVQWGRPKKSTTTKINPHFLWRTFLFCFPIEKHRRETNASHHHRSSPVITAASTTDVPNRSVGATFVFRCWSGSWKLLAIGWGDGQNPSDFCKNTQALHVWHIYLHWGGFRGQCM